MVIEEPLTNEDSSHNNQTIVSATSLVLPTLFIGLTWVLNSNIFFGTPFIKSVSINPGHTAFTLMLWAPNSIAADFVKPNTPCFDAQ